MGSINGYAAHAAGAELLPYKYSPGTLKPNDVEIQISHCGICHSDIHLINNDWGISEFPFIPGHEIVGKISAVGSEVNHPLGGAARGRGLAIESLRRYANGACRARRISARKARARVCIGMAAMPDAVRVNARFVIPIPEKLESENAAPLTVRRHYRLQPDSHARSEPFVSRRHCGHRRPGPSGAAVCARFRS